MEKKAAVSDVQQLIADMRACRREAIGQVPDN